MANVINSQSGSTSSSGWGGTLGLLGLLASPLIGPLAGGLLGAAGNALDGNYAGAAKGAIGSAINAGWNGNAAGNDYIKSIKAGLNNAPRATALTPTAATAPAAVAEPDKYNSLLSMYGINGDGKFNYNAARDYYKNFGGGDGVFAALRRSYNDWM